MPPAYGTYFFEIAGVGSPFQNSCILVAVGVVAIITNTLVITRYGRRRFFLTVGLVICGFVQLFVAVVYTVKPGSKAAGKAIIALSVLYIAGYNVSVPLRPILKLVTDMVLGYDRNICLALWRRNPFPAFEILYVRSRGLRRFLWRLARNVSFFPPSSSTGTNDQSQLHRSLLYQPSSSKLGSQVRIHLVPVVSDSGNLHLFLSS